jgi:hypothetical protein
MLAVWLRNSIILVESSVLGGYSKAKLMRLPFY